MISIIIPSYERFDLLQKAIESAHNQTNVEKEIIVIDDCSSDLRYLSLSEDVRIKYIRLEKRIGRPGRVRNLGLQVSKGEWVAFLDDDDYWFPNKLEEQSKFFNKYDFVSSDANLNDNLYSKEVFRKYWNLANPNNKNEIDFEILSKHNILITSTVCVRKEILEQVGLFDETMRHGEDYQTWLKILKNINCCYFIESPLITYNSETYKHYTDGYR